MDDARNIWLFKNSVLFTVFFATAGFALSFACPAEVSFPVTQNEVFDTQNVKENIVDRVEVTKLLKKIKTGYQKQEKLRKNFNISGVINPNEKYFDYVAKNNKTFLKLDVFFDNKYEVFKIDDTKYLYFLNPKDSLAIKLRDKETLKEWNMELTDQILKYYTVDMTSISDISDFCINYLCDPNFKKETGEEIEILIDTIDDIFYVINIIGEPTIDNKARTFTYNVTCDSRHGFLPVEIIVEEVNIQGRATWQQMTQVKNQLKEYVSGVSFILHGIYDRKTTGRFASDGTRDFHEELTVRSAQFGDFTINDDLFNVHSLPIKSGIRIRDARISPELDYIYDQEPFDIKVLDSKLFELGWKPPNSFSKFQLLRFVLVLIGGLLIVFSIVKILKENKHNKCDSIQNTNEF